MSSQRRATLMTFSSVLLAVAPKCPFCFFAYFGIFGVATTTLTAYRAWLPYLTALWLIATVALLATARGGRRRWGPIALGIGGAAAVFVAKFVIDEPYAVYGGMAALVSAVVWRSWTRPTATEDLCSACDDPPLAQHQEVR